MQEQEAVDLIYENLSGLNSIPIKLRRGDGLDREAVEQTEDAIRFLTEKWQSKTQVPKRLAAAFVDIQPAMEWGRNRYDEKTQEEIEDVGVELVQLVEGLLGQTPGDSPKHSPASDATNLFRFVPRHQLAKLPPKALVHDVSSKAKLPLTKLSPFYPHGGIPVPGMPNTWADSVEGIWQGLKLFAGEIDQAFFVGKGRKRRGRPEGHRFGDRVLGYIEARRSIYLPSYEYLWRECIGRDLRALLFEPAQHGIVQYFHDFEDNGDIEDASAPLAHASVLVRLLAEEFVLRH